MKLHRENGKHKTSVRITEHISTKKQLQKQYIEPQNRRKNDSSDAFLDGTGSSYSSGGLNTALLFFFFEPVCVFCKIPIDEKQFHLPQRWSFLPLGDSRLTQRKINVSYPLNCVQHFLHRYFPLSEAHVSGSRDTQPNCDTLRKKQPQHICHGRDLLWSRPTLATARRTFATIFNLADLVRFWWGQAVFGHTRWARLILVLIQLDLILGENLRPWWGSQLQAPQSLSPSPFPPCHGPPCPGPPCSGHPLPGALRRTALRRTAQSFALFFLVPIFVLFFSLGIFSCFFFSLSGCLLVEFWTPCRVSCAHDTLLNFAELHSDTCFRVDNIQEFETRWDEVLLWCQQLHPMTFQNVFANWESVNLCNSKRY